jgi:hypothetical protein
MGWKPTLPGSQDIPGEPGEPIFEPGEGFVNPINDPLAIDYNGLEPMFSFKSSKVNLKYNKLIPFIGIYLIYKFIL